MKRSDCPFGYVSLDGMKLRKGLAKGFVLSVFFCLASVPLIGWTGSSEEVNGRYCYTYGDEETPAQGEKKRWLKPGNELWKIIRSLFPVRPGLRIFN